MSSPSPYPQPGHAKASRRVCAREGFLNALSLRCLSASEGSAERSKAASDCSFRAAFRRPARGDMFKPLPLAYRLFRGQRMSYRQRWTRAFQPGRGADEPLRWSVTPAAKRETTLSQMRPQARFAVLLGRRTLPHLAGRSRSRIPRGKEISASVSEVRSAGISGWMRGKSHSGNRSDEPDSPSSSR